MDSTFDIRQFPVQELLKARKKMLVDLRSGTITASNDPLKGEGVTGRTLDIETKINLGCAAQVGLRVREGDSQQTTFVYDTEDQELRFDRTDAGVFFDQEYGTASAPLKPLDDGAIQLRVLVDRSSVEVFANHGRLTMTNRVFPDWDSTGVSLFAKGGSAEIGSFAAYELDSDADNERDLC